MEYTEEQQKVISHDHTKNGVVRAGPGTGKSLTVVELSQKLAAEHPELQIRFVTFTRAATSELLKKIRSAGGADLKPSTIHSFALSILMQNQDALPTQLPIRIPTEYEAGKIIYPYIGILIGKTAPQVEKLVRAKASMWESLDPDFSADISPEEKARFISAFQKATQLFGFTLMSQLPDLLRRLLAEHSDVKGLGFDFMIIDEFQDLNKCEIELLKLLNQRGIAILAVGDEDQSIYSFRQAHPAGIRDFDNNFSGAINYDLSICHRCPNNLLTWAQHVIQGDLARSPRPMPQSMSDKDAEIKLLHFPGDGTETKGVVSLIQKLISRGVEPHEILVLTRTDRDERFSKRIKDLLQEKGVPVFDSKAMQVLLESKEAKLLLAYLRLLENDKDSLAWYTLLAESPGIGSRSINAVIEQAESGNIGFGECINTSETLKAKPVFIEIKQKLDAIKQAYGEKNDHVEISWGKWIPESVVPVLSLEVPNELLELFSEVDTRLETGNLSLSFFVSQLSPIAKDVSNEQQTGVRFMTMQGSKGLTARATIVVGVDNDLIPSPRNLNQNEERRLLYVAMTRSQEFLAMTWANRRRGSQARSGTHNSQRRNYSMFLEGGSVNSEDGDGYIRSMS